MSKSSDWLERYELSHGNVHYPVIYWAAVPVVVIGAVGLLWILPIPDEFYDISPLLNWGTAFLMVSTVYYFIISLSLAIGMLPFVLGVAAFQVWLSQSGYSPLKVSTGLLLAGIIGLWLGHRRNGGLINVALDLQMMMIGPAWLLSVVYRRLGIPV
jgi:hypothetical protein